MTMADQLKPEDGLKQPDALDDEELDGVTGGVSDGNIPKFGTSSSGVIGLESNG
jgi:hypothetical protein